MDARGYADFRMGLIVRILDEGLTPRAVAEALEGAADTYRDVTYEECRRLRHMGEQWRLPG